MPKAKRHPPNLKGKEIGLFYAHRNKARQKQEPIPWFTLPGLVKCQIERVSGTCDQEVVPTYNNVTYDHVKDSRFKRDFLRVISETIGEKLTKDLRERQGDPKLDRKLYELNRKKERHEIYLDMLEARKKLPAYGMKDEIVKLVRNNQVVVISGETGCGKTTQVPQFILDDCINRKEGSLCKIVCTQPRRISAIAIAERVAEERVEFLEDSVGYVIRLEDRPPRRSGSICYCTTGIVLKVLENDAAMSSISHLILDEIHERDITSDFVLALVKQILQKRTDLKIILMSATLKAEKFSKYFNDAPHINIPGFMFPVQEYYLEDVIERTKFKFEKGTRHRDKALGSEYLKMIEAHLRNLEDENKYSPATLSELKNFKSEELNLELILELLIDICEKEKEEGAILVFLTGHSDISKLLQMINESGRFPRSKYRMYPLHSLLPTLNQKEIFERPPPGVRKIIVSTNIAETSITVDDVVYVIDSGRIKISNFDGKTNSESLDSQWESLANANQRKGRAGRVKPGVCFHLYSRARELLLEKYQAPEILRSRLENVVLTAKVLQLGKIENFFASLIDSPAPEAVSIALTVLRQLGALAGDEVLTPLGYHLAKLPLAPQIGKMVLLGVIFSCLEPILNVAVTLDFKDPFNLPLGYLQYKAHDMKVHLSRGLKSDHIVFHEALEEYENAGSYKYEFCYEYFLSSQVMAMLVGLKGQLMERLAGMDFVKEIDPKSPVYNVNSGNVKLTKAIICAALYPNVVVSRFHGSSPIYTLNRKRVAYHPKSVLHHERHFDSNLAVYYRKVRSSNDFIHDATLIHPSPVIFFGDMFEAKLIKDKLHYQCSTEDVLMMSKLRKQFNSYFLDKMSHPSCTDWMYNTAERQLLITVKNVITEDILSNNTHDYEQSVFYVT